MAARRAIVVVCDGLGAEWVTREFTPTLHELRERHLVASRHRAVFPSVTRVSAATIATGCRPVVHGLHGNQVALVEGGRLAVHDVGKPEFRDTLRRVTGGTLAVPALAERLASHGGHVAYSNVSPGAAYFLDPDHHGTVLHRAGSFGPGGERLAGAAHLDVTHDLAGDIAMTRRFCEEVVASGDARSGVLWLANPDLTLHHHPLGSPAHRDALRIVDRLVAMVRDALRSSRAGARTLLLVGSDHGHETIGASIHVGDWLAERGLGVDLRTGRIAVASQGTAALLYAVEGARGGLADLGAELRAQRWVDSVHAEGDLRALGLPESGALVAAIDLGRIEGANAHGIEGARWMAEDREDEPAIGCGQHGGLGARECAPFLVVAHPDLGPAEIGRASGLADIAPTILDFLGVGAHGTGGKSLLR